MAGVVPADTGASLAWHDALVERIERQGPASISVFLRSALRTHVAGQHVDVRLVADDGYEARRSYSIASAPCSASIELLIERLEDGEVSPFLHDVLQVGDTIELRGPVGGHFVWSPAQAGPLLLVAGGSGIAPLIAMLRDRAARAPAVDALLLYSARHAIDLAYRDELRAMAAADPHFTLVVTTTREPATQPGDFGRRVDGPMLADVLARLHGPPASVYVCGSTGFVETVSARLVDLGSPPAIIRAERYGGA